VELAPYRAGIPAGHMNCINDGSQLLSGARTRARPFRPLFPETSSRGCCANNCVTGDWLPRQSRHEGSLCKILSRDMAFKAVAAGCDILSGAGCRCCFATLRKQWNQASCPRLSSTRASAGSFRRRNGCGLFEKSVVDVGAVDGIVGRSEHKAGGSAGGPRSSHGIKK